MAKTPADWLTAMRDSSIQDTLRDRLRSRHTAERMNLDPGTGRVLATEYLLERDRGLQVSQGDILVRAEDAGNADEVLRNLGFSREEGPPCAGDCAPSLPVAIFSNPNASVAELTGAVEALLAKRINASFNHIVPDGGAKNGLGGPAFASQQSPLATAARPDAGRGVIVAVIDTGIAQCAEVRDDPGPDRDEVLSHIDIHPSNVDPLNRINQGESPASDHLDMGAGHGTFVAGVIRQIAPKATVKVYRALDSDGIGSEVGVACAILRACRDGATIINLSLGQETYKDRPPVALQAALELIPDDVVVVAAAGNLDDTHTDDLTVMRPHWPAAFRRVVAVGALTRDYERTEWSKRGHWVDVSTWGEDVVSTYVWGEEQGDAQTNPAPDTWPDSDPTPWARWTGTSFAAPQVAGMIAAGSTLDRYKSRATPRHALSRMLARGLWHEDMFGLVIPTPFVS